MQNDDSKSKISKDSIYLIVIVVLITLAGQFYYSYRFQPEHEIQVYYNQDRELNKEIIQLVRDADKFVYFAVYTFTRFDIKDALLAAKYRGLTVRGLTDKEQLAKIESQQKIVKELRDAGIPVYVQDHLGIMHLKTLVTDKAYASGSYNWTSAATNLNDEILEIGKNNKIRTGYQNILEELFNKYGKK